MHDYDNRCDQDQRLPRALARRRRPKKSADGRKQTVTAPTNTHHCFYHAPLLLTFTISLTRPHSPYAQIDAQAESAAAERATQLQEVAESFKQLMAEVGVGVDVRL